jgi:hypothetical protein
LIKRPGRVSGSTAIENEKLQFRRSAAWALSLGLELGAYFWLGFIVAPWATHRYGYALLFKILGYVVGIGCPINAIVRVVRDYNKQLENDDRPAPPPERPE